MDFLSWSTIFNDFCRNWYIEKGRCSSCGARTSRTLRFANYENPKEVGRHCDLCLCCLKDSPTNNRIDIFAFLAIRRVVNTRTCILCKRTIKKYITIIKGSTVKCACYNCFVYGDRRFDSFNN